jgi:hypothetical protein
VEQHNTLEQEDYSKDQNLKVMVIHLKTFFIKYFLAIKIFNILLFFQNLQGRDLQERHTGEHCGATDQYFGT